MSRFKNETQKRFSIEEDQPSNWFEPLYSKASTSGEGVPWANMETHPSFARWLKENPQNGRGKSALVVGCGMGDDAVELESLGFHVTAFDVSETAVKYCEERFPRSAVRFVQTDLLEEQPQWQRGFDLVVEIFTVQALPPKYEQQLAESISEFVAPGGRLVVVAEVGAGGRSFEKGPPWLLTPEHIDSFAACGLSVEGRVVEDSSLDDGECTFVTTFERARG